MPSIYDLWPDKWLRAAHLQGRQPTVAIETAAVEECFNPRTRKPEPKLILTFHGKDRRLILNKTQARALAAITGTDDYTAWPGHLVQLAPANAPNGQPTIAILALPTATSA